VSDAGSGLLRLTCYGWSSSLGPVSRIPTDDCRAGEHTSIRSSSASTAQSGSGRYPGPFAWPVPWTSPRCGPRSDRRT